MADGNVYVVMEHGCEYGRVIAVYDSETAATEHAGAEERRLPLIRRTGDGTGFSVEAYELRSTFDPTLLAEAQ